MSKRDEIIQLATSLIQKNGVNGFSFADIAEAIGIKKASIHYYFKSKSDLIEAVLDDYIEAYFQRLETIQTSNKQEDLKAFTEIYHANLPQGKICLCTDLSLEAGHLEPSVNQKVAAYFKANLDWLEPYFESRQDAEVFFASLQGAQVLGRNLGEAYFNHLVEGILSK